MLRVPSLRQLHVWIAALLCLLSLSFCFWTGLSKTQERLSAQVAPPGYDFAWIYALGHCWREGRNPYRDEQFLPVMRRVVPTPIYAHLSAKEVTGTQNIGFSPNALPLFAAIACWPWQSALTILWILNMLGVVAILFSTMSVIVPNWRLENKLLFAAALAQSRVIHLNSYRGQIGLFVFGLVMLAVWLAQRQRYVGSGISLGFSMVKFTFAAPMLIYYGLRRRGTILVVVLAITVAALLLGCWPIGGLSSLQDYRGAVRHFSDYGTTNDTSPARGSKRLGIDNIDVLLSILLGDNEAVVNTLHIVLLLGAAALLLRPTITARENSLTAWYAWSAWTLLGYLFVYHRTYDSVVLWPVAAVLLEGWRTRNGPRGLLAFNLLAASLMIFVLSIQAVNFTALLALYHNPLLRPLSPLHVWLVGSILVSLIWLANRPETKTDASGLAVVTSHFAEEGKQQQKVTG